MKLMVLLGSLEVTTVLSVFFLFLCPRDSLGVSTPASTSAGKATVNPGCHCSNWVMPLHIRSNSLSPSNVVSHIEYRMRRISAFTLDMSPEHQRRKGRNAWSHEEIRRLLRLREEHKNLSWEKFHEVGQTYYLPISHSPSLHPSNVLIYRIYSGDLGLRFRYIPHSG